ncbi:MAG: hypothetical protein V2A71_03100 [Candidatus Eisenbacteria bacterium]
MTRLSLIAALVLVTLASSVVCAWGQIPDPARSCWGWRNLACGDTKARVCPGGDESYMVAYIIDTFGNPIPGATVTAVFGSTCVVGLCQPVSGITGPDGYVQFSVCAGLNPTPAGCCVVTTAVTCLTITIPYCPTCPPPGGVCLPSDTRDWISPDLDADLVVGPLDFSLFVTDWLTGRCRTDYDCSGVVEALDYAVFAFHYLDDCATCW